MKILGNIIYGFFILLLVGIVGIFLASRMEFSGGVEIKIVKSGSMEPAIHTGSIVLIKPSLSYSVGDVITFGADSHSEIPTTHRISSVRNAAGSTFYATKGDANEEVDSAETHASKVIGKVLFTVPYAGFILDFARQPIGFGLLIGIPAALIILEAFLTIIREVRAISRRRKGKVEDAFAIEEGEMIDLAEREEDEIRAVEEIRMISHNVVGGEIYASPRPQQIHFSEYSDRKYVDGIRPWNDHI